LNTVEYSPFLGGYVIVVDGITVKEYCFNNKHEAKDMLDSIERCAEAGYLD